ncbi:Protein-L-isoaspartate O-methyltransferase [Streptomyces malaysiensis subsp. malaysiensis]|uniref:methyltransferase domain-containing protein n=1 Tax=Streptomyces malaysiensis TaxID=92644 RepID=UPI000CA302D9|nr:methyltransferase domain-containing protein [Streptomyces sp. M56]AUA11130.1 Protein-L-isoaspartate O-methyltransferase [Streptomyces sp. M56]
MRVPRFDGAPPRLHSLVEELQRVGAIRSAAWADAFASVPRHLFVPEWYGQEVDNRGITVWRRHDPADRDAWQAAVYSDQTLVTALDPDTAEPVDERAWTGIPTSSSTLPSLMARMLEDLAVEEGHRVLEVGTGTGYNAALLCARLGDRLVHSIDVSPALVETARGRLASAGYLPHLAAGDGQQGFPGHAPFDRTIATCSVPRIPTAWIEQTRPGGTILADVSMGIEGGLVHLTVDEERRALGRFTTTAGRFMAARGDANTYPRPERAPYAPRAGSRTAALTATDIRAHYPFRLLLAFHLPGGELVYHVDDETGAMSLQLQQHDGTWARAPIADEDTTTVTYGGSTDLWRQAETAWQWWNEHGRPAQDRFGYAREADGHHYAWHIPDGHRWPLIA